MLLREHPLMMYKGNRSWPPVWLWTAGYDTSEPRGEVGILKAVLRSHIEPNDRCFSSHGTRRSGIRWYVIPERCYFLPRNFRGATSKCRKNDSADWRNRSWQHSVSSLSKLRQIYVFKFALS